jgi:crotonobetainyl-CoA:carnitine CoA-transferase CaiB-like acyl-CoA transferase
MGEVSRDPAVLGGALRAEPHPRIPDYRAVAPPPTWDGRRAPPRRPPPAPGEHTDEVLRELGFSGSEIAALREEGVVE